MRTTPARAAVALLVAFFISEKVWGQNTSLEVNVNRPTGEAVANLRVVLPATGVSTTTDSVGHAMLRVNARVGDPIKLQIAPPPIGLRLMSPFEGQTSVPASHFVGMMVMRRGDEVALNNGSVLYGLMSRSAAHQAGEAGLGLRGARNIFLPAALERPLNDIPALIIPEVVADSGFTMSQVNQAIAALPADKLDWRMVLLTAALEFGRQDPFTSTTFNPFTGLSWGIGEFTFNRGMQRVLMQMQTRDPARFSAILGTDMATMRAVLATHSASEAAPLLTQMGTFEGSKFTLSAKWSAHFFVLGMTPEFQRIQIEAMHTLTDKARNRTYGLGFTSDRAVAVIYDMLFLSGSIRPVQEARFTNSVAEFARLVGRPPDEREKLALLNNIMPAHVSPLFRRGFTLRRCALLYDEPCTPALELRTAASYGITWRTIRGNIQVPLANDSTVLSQLKQGWIPSRGEVMVGPAA